MLPSAVDSLQLRDSHCVRPHRFINRLPVSSHTYTHIVSGRETGREAGGRKTGCFVLRLSGNKRQMGAVTSESKRMKETEIEREKKGNKRDRQRRERHSVVVKWRKNKV